jgi:methylenetetrahydrofolate reductase (NADPH)
VHVGWDLLFLAPGESGGRETYARELLRALRDAAGERFRIGVAAYPEGHPAFDVLQGLEILRAKAAEADFAVTQMCFDGVVVGDFVRTATAEGIRLPFWLGVPGRVGMTQLLRIAARIGVGPSLAFARKGSNRQLLARYDPIALRLAALAHLGEAAAALAGFHVFSFNALDRVDPRDGVDSRVRAGAGGF